MEPPTTPDRDPLDDPANERLRTEIALLEQYGLRWAVLAAWAEELHSQKRTLPPEVPKKLEEARIKISSGCFSTCTVGCILNVIEGALVSTATSSNPEAAQDSTDFWLELLAHAMADSATARKLLKMPAVEFHYAKCGFGPCDCGA